MNLLNEIGSFDMSKLVIVESPAKAKTIKKYLGADYEVMASMGHVRDLPKSKLGVDIDNNFKPTYVEVPSQKKVLDSLRNAAAASDKVYLATDPDREGEAISWHLAQLLGLNLEENIRVEFNEITKTGVTAGMQNPHKINMNLVDAQQARRILDRIVGYKLSPFLWNKVKFGLSAGRVQSVALRLIVEREKEIRAFKPEEYWSIDAKFQHGRKTFDAKLHSEEGKKKLKISNKEQAEEILKQLENAEYVVKSVKKGIRKRQPAPPFITSTLQQEAYRKLGFTSQRTMRVAQTLYEGVDIPSMGTTGLITYMRTDSLRISLEALAAGTNFIKANYGEKYLPENPRQYKSRSNIQDAHEAIRPTIIELTPDMVKGSLSSDQYRLYKLIWERFIASLMADCVLDTISADIAGGGYIFKASGHTVRFDGFTKLYVEGKDEEEDEEKSLPPLEVRNVLKLKKITPNQHFTQPPARYTESTLIKALDEKGIGRPSTYAPIIENIINRVYVEREKKQLKPTPLGEVVNDLLVEFFGDIVNVEFTANMEKDLDHVEIGERNWVDLLKDFYSEFIKILTDAEKKMVGVRVKVPAIETDVICENCGRKMVIKQNRYGKFLACPGFPECKNTKPLVEKTGDENEANAAAPANAAAETDVVCEKCGRKMVIKQGRFGKFLACPGYPECKNTKPLVIETPGICPVCGSKILLKRSKKGKKYYGCEKNPDCPFMTWDEPTAEKCPQCGKTLFKKGSTLHCLNEECGYKTSTKKAT